jgi:hypothetical protein
MTMNMIVARKTFFRALFDGDFTNAGRILRMVFGSAL